LTNQDVLFCLKISDTSVKVLGGDTRLQNVLKYNSCYVIADILLNTPKQIRKWRGMGDKIYTDFAIRLRDFLGERLFVCWMDEERTEQDDIIKKIKREMKYDA